MNAFSEYDPVIRWLIDWGERLVDVRVLILTSTRTVPDAEVDAFSDYDIIVVVEDVIPWLRDDSWLNDFARVLVVYRDPPRQEYDSEVFARITQYEETKIDYTIVPSEWLCRLTDDPILPEDLDLGYQVLLDKDNLTANMKPPTHRAYIPKPPSQEEYQERIETFFHEATYVAKHLARGDLMGAKYNLDYVMKHHQLLNFLEWRVEIDHNWSLRMRAYGRGLNKVIHPELWALLEGTYTGSGTLENWQALFTTIDLMRRLAREVGESLGYAYPQELDSRVTEYLDRIFREFGVKNST